MGHNNERAEERTNERLTDVLSATSCREALPGLCTQTRETAVEGGNWLLHVTGMILQYDVADVAQHSTAHTDTQRRLVMYVCDFTSRYV